MGKVSSVSTKQKITNEVVRLVRNSKQISFESRLTVLHPQKDSLDNVLFNREKTGMSLTRVLLYKDC